MSNGRLVVEQVIYKGMGGEVQMMMKAMSLFPQDCFTDGDGYFGPCDLEATLQEGCIVVRHDRRIDADGINIPDEARKVKSTPDYVEFEIEPNKYRVYFKSKDNQN